MAEEKILSLVQVIQNVVNRNQFLSIKKDNLFCKFTVTMLLPDNQVLALSRGIALAKEGYTEENIINCIIYISDEVLKQFKQMTDGKGKKINGKKRK